MKNYYLILVVIVNFWHLSAQDKKVALSEFQMSNNTSPAFQLMEETITDVYTPENVKALALHVQNNFGESIAIEVAPHFFIKSKNRTYYKYIGLSEDGKRQKPFSGLNTTTLSFAYISKDFENIAGDSKNKTFSVGGRTTIFRLIDKKRVLENAENLYKVLSDPELILPESILDLPEGTEERNKAEENFFLEQQKVSDRFKPFQKTIKPIFKIDGAIAYSNLFKTNSIKGGTANRFGTWLTSELNWNINKKAEKSTTNNYLTILLIARYIEDGFNVEPNADYTTNYYRDFGSKANFEFGRFSFGYEYIKRYGTIKSERSVGNISFAIDKNISVTGGFGKDFEVTDNLLAIFGINWGLNFGDSSASLK